MQFSMFSIHYLKYVGIQKLLDSLEYCKKMKCIIGEYSSGKLLITQSLVKSFCA